MATADVESIADDGKVPAEARREPEINKLFRMVMKHEGSDLHLKVGLSPMMRLRGIIRQMDAKALTKHDMERLVNPIVSEHHRKILEETGGADFAHIIGDDEGRYRVNVFKQRGYLSLVARRVNNKIPTFESLCLPPTIEDPIEYLFTDKKAVINQREIGLDVVDWYIALKHAVREDPDVILVGEMRDRLTFEAGLNAAETGHLVFGTVHASSAPSTLGRILDLFPADMHSAMRQSLAFNLKAIICQKLLPSIKPGFQRVPANEIMIVNPTIKDLIIKAEDKKLADAIKIGFIEGMIDFTESLTQLVQRGDVDRAAALEVAPNREALAMALKGIKISQPGIL